MGANRSLQQNADDQRRDCIPDVRAGDAWRMP